VLRCLAMILRLASTDARLILVVAMPAAADRHPTDAGHHLCLRRTRLASRPGKDGEERGRGKKGLASNMWDPRGSRC
jgi:hypothetical protein